MCVRYAGAVGTWHDLEVGRPIAAPLERCAQLLGLDLATVRELATKVEPYLHADATRVWSLMQLERQLRPEVYRRRRAATSTADEPRPLTGERGANGLQACRTLWQPLVTGRCPT